MLKRRKEWKGPITYQQPIEVGRMCSCLFWWEVCDAFQAVSSSCACTHCPGMITQIHHVWQSLGQCIFRVRLQDTQRKPMLTKIEKTRRSKGFFLTAHCGSHASLIAWEIQANLFWLPQVVRLEMGGEGVFCENFGELACRLIPKRTKANSVIFCCLLVWRTANKAKKMTASYQLIVDRRLARWHHLKWYTKRHCIKECRPGPIQTVWLHQLKHLSLKFGEKKHRKQKETLKFLLVCVFFWPWHSEINVVLSAQNHSLQH